LKKSSRRCLRALPLLFSVVLPILAGCGRTFYFANRALPPSGIANRALIAVQNPSPAATGILSIVDAYYDIRYSYNRKTPSFFIAGYGTADPNTIQNMPAEQFGAVYSTANGSFSLINYATEALTATVAGLPGYSASIFVTSDQRYVFAANPLSEAVTVIDRTLGTTYTLNLPNAYRISVSPGGSVVLVFVQNSDLVYSVLRLQNNQQVPANAQDCEPQNQPVYCLVPVPGPAGQFNRPIKAVFSPDGNTAYVLNCAIECGGTQPSANYLPGTQAAVSYLPTAGVLIQSGAPVPTGSNTLVTATVPIPGGATDAIASGNTLYIAGQQPQSNGLYAGMLSVLDTPSQRVLGTYSISDGNHTKMVFGDANTLWIGSQLCTEGVRYQQVLAGAQVQYGCLTMFNTATNTVTSIDSYKGDATGIAAITNLGKVYTTEGGQVYIYSTADGSALDNTNVTVVGTAYDVAYMDAPTDADNTDY
jgi:hypothetical protein